jgi:hypothetical protein
LPGVRAVWFHQFSRQHDGIWVLIAERGESVWLDRRRVHAEILNYLRFHRQAMEAGFILERYVFMEHEELAYPPIPPGACRIAAWGSWLPKSRWRAAATREDSDSDTSVGWHRPRIR